MCQLVKESPSNIKVIPAHTELAKVDALYGKGFNVVNKLNSALQTEVRRQGDPVVIDCNPMVGVLS